MLSGDLLLFLCLGYVALLFAIAFYVDRLSRQGRAKWLYSPVVFTLSISVYCTSWTFYGAVGSAARNGLEFITIYLGPTLVFVGWWWLLRKLVRIGRAYKITSIADLISSRYGKSPSLGILVTIIALVATTPYIALQLQSVTRSYQVIVGEVNVTATAFAIAAGMALFTILFGTRNLDANERHHGVVAAIAVEAVVKLIALLAVGFFVVFGIADGMGSIFNDVDFETVYGKADIFDARWVTLTFLSATAIICLPRQFQVTVVENVNENHLATASWLFPLYLFGMCIFVMPIAIAGLKFLPAGANPDLYVLTLPLSFERQDIALLAFIGGFSSATSMVIVAAIAVSTMVSNHIVMPITLRFYEQRQAVSGDVRKLLLTSRRVSIAAVLGLGFLYFQISGGSDALAAIGLIAFVGVAQFMPSLVGGIFWRGATRTGALSGMIIGFILWAYTLFLPSFGGEMILSNFTLENGLFGINELIPQALFGLNILDPLVHALVWSLGMNTLIFLIVSSLTQPEPIERLQGALFVDVFRKTHQMPTSFAPGHATSEDVFVLAQRIMGAEPARRLFDEIVIAQDGVSGQLPYLDDAVISRLERELAGSVGAASAHAMVLRITGQENVSMTELMDIADETQRLIETHRQLTEKSNELSQALSQLREANQQLKDMDFKKDEFMSQISHELRTPMTSILSFSEILLANEDVSQIDQQKFLAIIHDESQRLTRLLDEIIDVGRLESGSLDLPITSVDAVVVIKAAIDSISGLLRKENITISRNGLSDITNVHANEDRLRQVLINILSNAVKYNNSESPEIKLVTHLDDKFCYIDISDNGGGVSREDEATIFEKFRRGQRAELSQGAGLGLPISRAIVRSMGGDLSLEFTDTSTSFFRIKLLLSAH